MFEIVLIAAVAVLLAGRFFPSPAERERDRKIDMLLKDAADRREREHRGRFEP